MQGFVRVALLAAVALSAHPAWAQNQPKTGGAVTPAAQGGAGDPLKLPAGQGTQAKPGGATQNDPAGGTPDKQRGDKGGMAGKQDGGNGAETNSKKAEPAGNAAQQKPAAASAQTKKQDAGQSDAKAGSPRPAAKLDQTQQTRVREEIRNIKVQPIRVDFKVNVGVAVPRTVVLEPLPLTIVTYVPEYEGFRFFVTPGEIVIVDPVSFEIVAVLPL